MTKKLIAVTTILLLLILAGVSAAPGDSDGNGTIEIVDSLMAARYYVGFEVPGIHLENADVDGSGSITIVDALLIARYVTGLIDYFPVRLIPPQGLSVPDNLPALMLSDSAEEALIRDGVVIIDTPVQASFTTAYQELANNNNIPVFITTDSLLHAFHLTFSSALDKAERFSFYTDLTNLLAGLYTRTTNEYNNLIDENIVKEGARELWFFLAVANALIRGESKLQDSGVITHPETVIRVNTELNNILSYEIRNNTDYTIFRPAGHYARTSNSSLIMAQYFRTFQWLRTRGFDLKPGLSETVRNRNYISTAILSYLLMTTPAPGGASSSLLNLWSSLRNRQQLFFNAPESLDLSIPGSCLPGTPPDYRNLADTATLQEYRDTIESLWPGQMAARILDTGNKLDTPVLQESAAPLFPERLLPSGLDVAATALDSTEALNLQTSPALADLLQAIKNNHYTPLQEEEWLSSAMNRWFYTLRSLSSPPQPEGFLNHRLWDIKKLNTQLASWTEIYNSDTQTIEEPTPTPPPCLTLGDVNGDGQVNIVDALMVAQYSVGLPPIGVDTAQADVNLDGTISIIDALILAQYSVGLINTLPPGGATPSPSPTPTPTLPPVFDCPKGFIEPQPEFYGLLAKSCRSLAAELTDFLEAQPQSRLAAEINKLSALADMAEQLESIATTPLRLSFLSDQDYNLIHNWGTVLCNYFNGGSFIREKQEALITVSPLAAFEDTTLHTGTGELFPIYVKYIVPETGAIQGALGFTFSYYEFEEYDYIRLTDQEWLSRLNNQTQRRPSWMEDILTE